MDSLEQRLRHDHYTNEQGFFVFTEKAHIARGYCCGSGCLHCPFEPRAQQGVQGLRTEIQEQLEDKA